MLKFFFLSMDVLGKFDDKAIALRVSGNKLYQNRKFFEALLKYNESLCVASSNECLSMTYANRSAVFFELELYDECLINLHYARINHYPIEKMSKLDDRQGRCLELQQTLKKFSIKSDSSSDQSDFFKLSYSSNQKIPFIIDGLQLEFDEKYGRKIITNRPLKVGDIISNESPFFGVIQSNPEVDSREKPTNKFNYCDNCLSDNLLNLFPCNDCNSVMFCNDGCGVLAQNYHQYECELSAIFQNLGYKHIALRFFFKALAIMDGSITDLESLFDECLESPKTIFDLDFSNPKDPEHSKNQLKVALSLARDKSIEFQFDAIEIICFLKVKHLWDSHEKFIRKFVLHAFQIQRATRSELVKSSLWDDSYELVGRGIFLFGAYMNHSCVPNVCQSYAGERMCLVVVRPIEKGEHLVDSYIEWFHMMSKAKRQKLLKPFFACDCEACRNPNRFPLFPQLKIFSEELLSFANAVFNKDYANMKRKDTIKHATIIKKKMQDSFSTDQFPSHEFFLMHDAFRKCIRALVRRDNQYKFSQNLS